jgi:hypothetical protein
MRRSVFDNWVKTLGEGWTTKDPQKVANVCAGNILYYEDPFQSPIKGRDSVRKLWADVPVSQKDVEFKHELLATKGNVGIAHFSASFTRIPSGVRSHLEGVFLFTLNENGLCSEFHWWWNTKDDQR